jgi:hypothetical protein
MAKHYAPREDRSSRRIPLLVLECNLAKIVPGSYSYRVNSGMGVARLTSSQFSNAVKIVATRIRDWLISTPASPGNREVIPR